MLVRSIYRWAIGIVAVVAAVAVARQIGLRLEWPSVWNMVVFVPVLALANATIGPVVRLVSMPVTCLTLGLFGFVVNALVFWAAGAATGAEMTFLSALFGSVCTTVIAAPLSRAIKESR